MVSGTLTGAGRQPAGPEGKVRVMSVCSLASHRTASVRCLCHLIALVRCAAFTSDSARASLTRVGTGRPRRIFERTTDDGARELLNRAELGRGEPATSIWRRAVRIGVFAVQGNTRFLRSRKRHTCSACHHRRPSAIGIPRKRGSIVNSGPKADRDG